MDSDTKITGFPAHWIVFFVGLFLTVAASVYVSKSEQRSGKLSYEIDTQQVINQINTRMIRYESLLVQTRGFIESHKNLAREQFANYAHSIDLTTRYPGIQGLGYALKIFPKDLKKHTAAIKSGDLPDYKVWPDFQRDEYFSILYLEPMDWRNRRAIGFDMYTAPVRREAMARARDTGKPSLSGKVKLVQEVEADSQPGFLLYLPLYKPGAKLNSIEDRRNALIAFVYSPFRSHDLFHDIFKGQTLSVDFEIFAGSDAVADALVYDHDGKPGAIGANKVSRFSSSAMLSLAGHPFLIRFASVASYKDDLVMFLPYAVALFGLIITFLLWWVLVFHKKRVDEAILAKQQILSSEKKFLALFQSAPYAVGLADCPGQRFTDVNPEFENLTGYKRAQVLGKTSDELGLTSGSGFLTQIFSDLGNNTKPTSLEMKIKTKAGKEIVTILSARKVEIQNEMFVLFSLLDISPQKEAELALRIAKDEAEHANELKSAFLANMSHEIRTPLGAMIGFADLLRDPELTAQERASYIDVLTRNGDSLAVIINDILDLSKVEAGHLVLDFKETSPKALAEDVISLLKVKADEKALPLEYVAEATTPDKIVADPLRLRQILINLVGNAIKFTKNGSVKLTSFGMKTNDNRTFVCFEIADTGIGIEASQIENVFEMFVQGDGSMTRRFGGTGLGLALSRKLAEAMGGTVRIKETKVDVGSTFLVMIEDQPAKISYSKAEESYNLKRYDFQEQVLSGYNFLVVDDAPDNQQLIKRYLERHGANVEIAENGSLGCQTALSGKFDIVLMDIQMPVMDGYMATQKLREAGYRKPVIALTAHAMSEVRKKALNVGFTDHLTKPINPDELLTVVVRHLQDGSRDSANLNKSQSRP